MGVEGVFPFLKSEGIEGTEVDTRTFAGRIHVDVMSLFRAYIIATETSIKTRIERSEARSPGSTANENPDLYLATALEARLSKLFLKSRDILHFDGAPTRQKSFARTKRAGQRRTQVAKAGALIDNVMNLLNSPVDPQPGAPPITRSKRQKIVKLSKFALINWKYARVITRVTQAGLVTHLQNNQWTVCRCRGEADVCIRGQQQRPITVASSDSDFLFHSVDTLLRQDPRRRNTFLQFNVINDVLEPLGIREEVWVAAGIVSNSDYSSSVFRQGFPKNLSNMTAIDASGSDTKQQLLRKYCEAKDIMTLQAFNQHITDATAIFLNGTENIVVIQPVDNINIDNRISAMIARIQVLFAQYKHYRQVMLGLAVPGPVAPGLVAPGPAAPGPVIAMANPPANHPANPPADPSRPFKKYMPPNRYQPQRIQYNNNVNGSNDENGSSDGSSDGNSSDGSSDGSSDISSDDDAQPAATAKKHHRTIYNKSSRRARATGGTNNEAKGSKSRDPYVIIDDFLSNHFATITMDCGTLKTQLRKGLGAKFLAQEGTLIRIRKLLLDVIQEMVRIGTEVTRLAQQAIACYIAETTHNHPSLTRQDIKARKDALDQFGGFHNNAFFANLFQDIFNWHNTDIRQGRPRAENARETIICRNVIAAYRRKLREGGPRCNVPNLRTYLKGGLSTFFQNIGPRLGDQIQTHFLRYTSELLYRLQNHNRAWYSSPEGQGVINTINNDGKSTVHDQASLFWILNSHLPSAHQLAFLPESGFCDQFFHISEQVFLDTLLSKASDGDKAAILGMLGGTPKAAKQHITDHAGNLFFNLFFHPGLDYFRNTVLVNPDTDDKKNFRHTAKRKLLMLRPSEKMEFERLVKDLKAKPATATQNKSKEQLQEFLKDRLKTPEENKVVIDESFVGHNKAIRMKRNNCRYVLTGTMVTNGYELKLLAYSLTKPKPVSHAIPNTIRNKLKDILTELSDEGQVEYLFPNQDRYVVAGIDPGIHNTATATILASDTSHQSAINLSISQGSQTYGTLQYQKELNNAKQKMSFAVEGQQNDINALEQSIRPIICQQVTDSQTVPWRALSASIIAHVMSVVSIQNHLREFYGSYIFKMKSRYLKQAKMAVLNKGVSKLLNTAGCKEKWTGIEDGFIRVLVAVGDGEFGSFRGRPMFHQQFISFLKKKASCIICYMNIMLVLFTLDRKLTLKF